MDQLLEKLKISKAIMDKSERIKRGDGSSMSNTSSTPSVQEFDMPNVKYNIPQEFLQESPSPRADFQARENTKPVGVPTVEAIKNSKLPDQIKKLMIEHPIAQPQQSEPVLSDDLIKRASRLMGTENSPKPVQQEQREPKLDSIDPKFLKKLIKETVEETLRENGVIAESSEKSNEPFSIKIGKHVFEGKVLKIKKML